MTLASSARRARFGRGGPPPNRGARADRARSVAGALGLLALFEIVPRTGLVPTAYLPPLTTVLDTLGDQLPSATFWETVWLTVRAWGLGLALATGAAVLVGLLIGGIPGLRAATASTIDFLRPIPSVIFIPLAVLVFNGGLGATLFLVVYSCFWLVLIQVLYGIQDVDPIARDAARSIGLGPLAQARHVVWPSLLPYLMTGLRLAASVSLVLTVTAGLVIGAPGLGRQIWLAQAGTDIPLMYGLILVTGLLGIAVNTLVQATERRLLHWHISIRREVG